MRSFQNFVKINFGRFLVRKDATLFIVDSQKLLTRIALLKDHLLIAKFVGPKPSSQALEKCGSKP